MTNKERKNKFRRILLTGGGTGGSIISLLAIKEKLEQDGDYQFLWIGTRYGVEKDIIKNKDIEFYGIVSGKLRRYFDWKNFIDPFKILASFFQSLFFLWKWKPNLILSTGSFVSVPVAWAGWLLRVPVLIHQQDIRPGLANKLMYPVAAKVTVTFKESVSDYGNKAVWTGNPVRNILINKDQKQKLNISLKDKLPVVLIVGGGTGSLAINKLVVSGIDELLDTCQVVHITGKDKMNSAHLRQHKKDKYFCYEFLEPGQMMAILQVANVVVSRAGLGLLTELSYTAKPSIIIPIPDSHQEDNVRILQKNKASVILDQTQISATGLVDKINELLNNEQLRNRLSENMGKVMKRRGSENVVEVIKELI